MRYIATWPRRGIWLVGQAEYNCRQSFPVGGQTTSVLLKRDIESLVNDKSKMWKHNATFVLPLNSMQ